MPEALILWLILVAAMALPYAAIVLVWGAQMDPAEGADQ